MMQDGGALRAMIEQVVAGSMRQKPATPNGADA
jgi:hypothetical protein